MEMVLKEETKKAIERIEELLPAESLHRDEPMSRHTSFRIGGPAALFAVVQNEKELAAVLRVCSEESAEHMLIGNGSNLLVSDDGYPGIAVKLGGEFENIGIVDEDPVKCESEDEEGQTLVRVGAAVLMSRASAFMMGHGLSGFEFASGIPGSIGGAIFMNAGAYGGEIKDILESAGVMMLCREEEKSEEQSQNAGSVSNEKTRPRDAINLSSEETRPQGVINLSNEEMCFGYRSSRAQQGDMVILSALLRLKKDDSAEISARVSELAAKRNEKQPVNYPSAGSTFKRPPGGYAAALIEEAGLKGYKVGGAAVSEKHSGFVINEGGASCEDVLAVMRHVRECVYEKSGIMLEPEVRLINCEL